MVGEVKHRQRRRARVRLTIVFSTACEALYTVAIASGAGMLELSFETTVVYCRLPASGAMRRPQGITVDDANSVLLTIGVRT